MRPEPSGPHPHIALGNLNMISLQAGMLGRGTSISAGSTGGGGDSFAGETSVQVYANGQGNGANNFTVDDSSVNSSPSLA